MAVINFLILSFLSFGAKLAHCFEEPIQIESSNELLLQREEENDDRFREFSAGKGEKGLFPSIFNLATHAEIRATATCGQNGPDYYCKLVEHVFLRQPQCDICDANNHHKNHPIDYAIDGTKRWWQSPTLSNGLSFERVNITLDLRQTYQVAYVIIKAAISPRPGTWVLEKSLDGIEFSPWQFFAASDSECMRIFGVPASTGVPKFSEDDEVICTSYFSKLNPLEYGEIHISLVNGRPGAEKSSQKLQEFTRTRFVRLRLLGLKTLYADLMVINQRDKKLDHSVTRRYFYTISDISIGGQCICFGHAERCTPDVVHGQFRCECRHNTCGESCSECCPLFNQLPWRIGTHDHPNVCQPCQCFNHAIRCEYDEEVERQRQSVTPEGIYEGGGRCIECQHNTEGVNCEKCRAEFYRPTNISHYRHDACRPCDCDQMGAESNICVRDETEAFNGLRPGDCRCKPGFGGRRCDRCALGFRNHPICEPCPCHQAGSLNFETCEEEHCICKSNVEGEKCDRCKPGTIYLEKDNPLGCQQCFCFGESNECREFPWNTGHISHRIGWNLTDLHGQLQVPHWNNQEGEEEDAKRNGGGQLLIFNAEDHEQREKPPLYYWKAPKPFLGNRLNSFGANLHYYVYYVPKEPSKGHSTPIADVILEGNGAKLEFYSRLNFFPRENISVNVPLKPTDNWYDARTRRPVDKAAMMRALADMSALWIRARYHQDQMQSSIYGLQMEMATSDFGIPSSSTSRIHPVEICTCPEHFEGNSCERCEVGYRRVNDQLYDGQCKRCECQGHSQRCDPFTGDCLDCQHNTTGPRCELCQPAFYGNPSLGGILGQCRPCACPTVANSHSSECTLSQLVLDGAAAAGEDEYVCTACEQGYDGNKCEICADGYFGDPITSECRPCECSGNIDPAAIGNCDRETGECLRCIGHTTGPNCDECLENHWGSAILHNCRPCRCHPIGAISPQCSNETGQCECHPGYTGERCDRCEFGHGDVDNGCPECQCNSTGSLGTGCDEVSGQCVCKKGVYGKRCEMCVPSYYNFGPEGCQFCHCNEYGAIDGKECHNVTGECQCQANVIGLKCEECEEGFFNLTSGQGCQPCLCDSTGSIDENCEQRSGQCRCKPGVGGTKCDRCEPNYYGFGVDGCKQCRICPALGQVCDSITGECVCPPNTQGEMCEHCTQNAWNYHPYRGCQLCECDGIGADSQICDARTGQCKCKSGYVGHRCDLCEPGYYSFPDCRPCECELAGTEMGECRANICLCSNEGQCRCKKNVRGQKCDQCAENAFSLEAWNPLGCTECFCFGRATKCRQAELVWRQSYAPDRKVLFEAPFEMFERKHNLHVLKESPFEYNSYPTNHTPLYWPMPESFKHDRTASYNGFLRFRIRNDDNYRGRPGVQPDPHTFRLFPQVVLIGNTRIELEHLPEKLGGEDGKYKVRLHESQWRNRISPQVPVTRKQMMIALLRVQHIFIRATYNDMYRGDAISISEVSLDVATEGGVSGDAPALGVEECLNCAEGWMGRSCQDAASGFHIYFEEGYLNRPDDIVLAGLIKPCACHGHSNACDPKTGECIDCQHNTVGTRCEHCRDGYYGNALSGSPDACHRCACPLADNSFSQTCRQSQSTGRGYICDGCRPGYTGDYCENCEPGYYGNPSIPGGFCALCACHPHGSLSPICHNTTGQCECRDGVDGRDCSACRPRHAFLNGVCTSCDRGCYHELMRMEDEMEYSLGPLQTMLAETKPIPRKRLARIGAAVSTLDSLLDSIGAGAHGFGAVDNLLLPLDEDGLGEGESRPLRQARLLEQEFQLLQERNNDSLAKLREMGQGLGQIRAKVQAENRRVVDIINQLAQFARRSSQTAPGQINNLLAQGQALLESTRQRMADIEKKYNYAKKNAEDADKLLREILARKLNHTSYEHLAEKHQQFQGILRDFRDALWDRARAGSLAAKNQSQMAKNGLERLEKTIKEIENVGKLAEEELANGRQNVAQIEQMREEIGNFQKELADSLIPAARSQRDDGLESLEAEMDEALRELRGAKMLEAERHAHEMEQQASKLRGRFTEIEVFSMDALAASNAYESIVHALQNATAAAAVAKRNAEEAFAVVDPNSEGSLATMANASAIKSEELNRRVDSALESLGVREQSERLEKTLDEIEASMKEAQRKLGTIKDVQQLLEDHHDRINTVYTAVDEAHSSLGDIEEGVTEFNDAVTELKHRTDAVQQFTSASIQESIRNLTESAGQVNELEKAFEVLKARTDEHSEQFQKVRADLGVLKEKINEAREKASKIRIGVRSEPGAECIREYISPMRPSPSNTILVKYRPAMDTPDSLIFFTQVQGTRTQNREFLAVELKQKKIYVHWDIGGGKRTAAIIKRNIVYIPASDRYTWYHIEVKRVANTMQVSVVQRQTLGGEGSRDVDEPTKVMVGEPKVQSEVIFNVVPGQTRLSLGLSDSKVGQELGLVTNKFHGTVGELNVDGVNVPLWVFAHSEGACDGATGPPAKIASGHLFRDGFAQIRMPMAERASTMLTVQFSAYSPNGLLYFRGSAESGEFIALELNEGAVAVKADFGPAAKIALQTNGSKYADGRAHKVRVIRKDGEVHLQLDPENEHVSIALADGQALLDIAEPDHFVGGVPPDFARHEFTQDHDIHFDGFFGCIHSVRPNQVSELDLDNPTRAQRKEPGCRYQEERLSTTERVIGFQGAQNGFLKTRGILLDTDATFAFNFRTRSENAILVYESADLQREEEAQKARRRRRMRRGKGAAATEFLAIILGSRGRRAVDPDDHSFLAISLIKGRLTVHLGTDSRERAKSPLISSTQTYDDGLLHSLFISRDTKEIQVRIDDREVLATVLVDEQQQIGGTNWAMLLGGVPSKFAKLLEEAEAGTTQSLIGCLSDFQFNYERMPILLEEHRGTILGQCALEDGTNELETSSAEEMTTMDVPLKLDEAREEIGSEIKTFHRKKSRQSLEPAEPTIHQQQTVAAFTASELSSGIFPSRIGCYIVELWRKEYPQSSLNYAPTKMASTTASPQCSQSTFASSQMAFSADSIQENGIRFGVADASHSRLNFDKNKNELPNQANFSISFEFRTQHREGLLWAWANYRNFTRFLLLHLHRGFVQLEMKHHRRPKTLHYKARRLNDGKWHRLDLSKFGKEVRLEVDDLGEEIFEDAPNPRVTRKRMYVGGLIGRHRRKYEEAIGNELGQELAPTFQGCIRHFQINGIEQNLLLASRDLIPCSHSPGIVYVHKGGFATFASFNAFHKKKSASAQKYGNDGLEMGIRFRLMPEGMGNEEMMKDGTDDEFGRGRMLIGMMSPKDGAFKQSRLAICVDDEAKGALALSIHLANWRIQFQTVFDGTQSNNVTISSPIPLLICPGQWHHLRLAISTNSAISISLDGQNVQLDSLHLPKGAIHELRSMPIQIGGTNVQIANSLALRSMFGCIKHFELDGNPVEIGEKIAKKWHKMVADGCPGA